jgi:hypothetical protein
MSECGDLVAKFATRDTGGSGGIAGRRAADGVYNLRTFDVGSCSLIIPDNAPTNNYEVVGSITPIGRW